MTGRCAHPQVERKMTRRGVRYGLCAGCGTAFPVEFAERALTHFDGNDTPAFHHEPPGDPTYLDDLLAKLTTDTERTDLGPSPWSAT